MLEYIQGHTVHKVILYCCGTVQYEDHIDGHLPTAYKFDEIVKNYPKNK